MLYQMFVFAVHRNKELRFCQCMNQLQFFLAGMTRNVNIFINHFCTGTHQFIDYTGNMLFIARNRVCRDDDEIIRCDNHFFMAVHCHTSQSGHRFALAARGNQNDPFIWEAVHFININQHTLRDFQISHLQSDVDNIHHTSAEYGNLSVAPLCIVYNLLNPVDIRGESCNDNPLARCLLKQLVE